MYWECRWRGYSEMADQAKTPLKIVQSCSNFHRILNLQQWMKLHWSQDLKGDIMDFSLGVGLACPPSEGVCQIYHNLLYLKPLFNFLHVLKINKDILRTFGALHLRTEIIELEYCCKMVKNRCKSAKTSTKILVYNSEIWPENQLAYNKSNCIGFRITSSIAVIIGVIFELQKGPVIGVAGGGLRFSQNLHNKSHVSQ